MVNNEVTSFNKPVMLAISPETAPIGSGKFKPAKSPVGKEPSKTPVRLPSSPVGRLPKALVGRFETGNEADGISTGAAKTEVAAIEAKAKIDEVENFIIIIN